MEKFNCLSMMCGYGHHKDEKLQSKALDFNRGLKSLKVRVEKPMKPLKSDETGMDSINLLVPQDSSNVKVMDTHEASPENDHTVEVSYEEEHEHEENASLKRDLSDLDLQARLRTSDEEEFTPTPRSPNLGCSRFGENGNDFSQSGHISDPGTTMAAPFMGMPKLNRSCSNLEIRRRMDSAAPHSSRLKYPNSGESQELPVNFRPGSPVSVTSRHSADRVMLKKHSSSQILPSGSRKLWWKLFLWSHRNLHKASTAKPEILHVSNQQGGYSSDTLEQSLDIASSKMKSSTKMGLRNHDLGKQKWDGFDESDAHVWPRNHWVANAFSVGSSPLARVDQWVQDIEIQPPPEDENADNCIDYPPSPEAHRSPARTTSQVAHPSEDVAHANSVILSLNSSSTVAHICGTGLKVIPSLSTFSSLRIVDLSNNYIVSISPGSLPRGLHAVNLARNKINSIEGLRELTKLRVLDLSYNRISRIGQGLSSCTLIKELYLSGNKISDVEGLHRLLKLRVLDLSFNKITATKSLGQLVANYKSLQALNLLGNPIQANISDEQLRRAVYDLLPNLKYLNKQSIKTERVREVAMDSVARAALGSSSSSFGHRRNGRKMDCVGSSSFNGQRSMASAAGAKRSKKSGKKSRSRGSKGRASSSTPSSSRPNA